MMVVSGSTMMIDVAISHYTQWYLQPDGNGKNQDKVMNEQPWAAAALTTTSSFILIMIPYHIENAKFDKC